MFLKAPPQILNSQESSGKEDERSDYPRVLIVAKTRLNDVDSVGASLRNWFHDWPEAKLAQIYSGKLVDSGFFCRHEYQLKAQDRRFGSLFFRIKGSTAGAHIQTSCTPTGLPANKIRAGLLRQLMVGFAGWFLNTGLWELIFSVRLSKSLQRWVQAFDPQVIYAQGFDISFMRLPLLIEKRFRTPICFHAVDDWGENLYSQSIMSPLTRFFVRRNFRSLLRRAQWRVTIGFLMQREYIKRYGVSFDCLMQCDDPSRFGVQKKENAERSRPISIVYSGSVALGRWQSIVDLARALQGMNLQGSQVELHVYAPIVNPELREAAAALPNLILKGSLRNENVAGVFTRADILFLPESFDNRIRSYIRLSVSTKAHLYMFSRRPILVYGPEDVGVVEYAKQEGWGIVVTQRDTAQLREAVRRILSDSKLRSCLLDRASEVVARNHNGPTVRSRFRDGLRNLAVSNANIRPCGV